MTRITVSDLLSFVRMIEQLKGKYIKNMLTDLEYHGKLDPQTRKILLDGTNSLVRSIFREIGYNVES